MKTIDGMRALLTLAILTLAAALGAAPPEKPPHGQGKYLIVLWDAGTPVPGKPDQRMKKMPEPEAEQLGGRLLAKQANRRVMFLPYAAARQLRKHQAVAYVQRIWMGEPPSEWNEADAATTSLRAAQVESHVDPAFTWDREYTYDADGNIERIGADQFAYDDLGRLTAAIVDGSTQGYTYDDFGNLTSISRPGSTTVSVPADPMTNRMIGETYDAAGNVTSRKARGTYAYDALNMIVEMGMTPGISRRRILYDANDERIGTLIDSMLQRWTIRDFDGQVLREFTGYDNGLNLVWSWEQDHIRGEGQLIAGETVTWQYNGDEDPEAFQYGGKRHYHLDHLGSVRVVTNQAGKALAEHDFYPFGTPRTKQHQEQLVWGQPHEDAMRFAGHWRDFLGPQEVEDDEYLDFMHARYYDPNLGRFLSVDPTWKSADLGYPQSWNRYSYVMNNPVNRTDPDGRCFWDVCVAETALVHAAGAALTAATIYVLAPSTVVSGQTNGQVMLSQTVDGAEAVGRWLVNGNGGGGDELAAETFAQNMSNHMAEQAENRAPSIDKPDSFTGAKPKDVRDAIPENWGEGRPTRDGTGTRWANPDKLGEGVRIMPGTPGAKDPTHAGPYAVFTQNGKEVRVPLEGNPALDQEKK